MGYSLHYLIYILATGIMVQSVKAFKRVLGLLLHHLPLRVLAIAVEESPPQDLSLPPSLPPSSMSRILVSEEEVREGRSNRPFSW